jgi:hypothetical protein
MKFILWQRLWLCECDLPVSGYGSVAGIVVVVVMMMMMMMMRRRRRRWSFVF